MARKLRLEEAGGLYHVINRGNYRQPVFGSVGAAQAFETTLRETVERHGWRVHAYVLMTNHYHLALETPQPNLVDGMHWLQSTFATRFNRFRAERGHLFQGRYQALPIEDVAALARVVDYIHLNPVRAGLVPAEQLAGFRWSSLRKFLRGERWPGLTGERVMPFRGLADQTAGWAEDEVRLRALAGDEAEQKRRGFDELSKGWAIGTAGWRSALAKELAQKDLAGMSREEARGVREDRWRDELAAGLAKRGKTSADLAALRPRQRGEPWRHELAVQLRRAGAPHGWIAQTLGYPSTGSLRVRLNAKA